MQSGVVVVEGSWGNRRVLGHAGVSGRERQEALCLWPPPCPHAALMQPSQLSRASREEALAQPPSHAHGHPHHPIAPCLGCAGGGGAFQGRRESGKEATYSCVVLGGARSMDERRAALKVGGC